MIKKIILGRPRKAIPQTSYITYPQQCLALCLCGKRERDLPSVMGRPEWSSQHRALRSSQQQAATAEVLRCGRQTHSKKTAEQSAAPQQIHTLRTGNGARGLYWVPSWASPLGNWATSREGEELRDVPAVSCDPVGPEWGQLLQRRKLGEMVASTDLEFALHNDQYVLSQATYRTWW